MRYLFILYLLVSTLFVNSQDLLTEDKAARYAGMALKCIHQEYPNKPGEVLGSDRDVKPVREYRPAFYGCFDWHSAVHGHWMLVKLLKKFPDSPDAAQIKEALSKNLRPENIAVEVQFFLDSNNRTFERPYGWAWLLKLAEELHTWDHPLAREWESALQPLTNLIVSNYQDFLPKLVYPVRVGEHSNTAFGMAFALDYARTTQNKALEATIVTRARDFYLSDENCPIGWEPSGFDFFSPCFTEAELMARVLPEAEFSSWIHQFLPTRPDGRLAFHDEPARVGDRSDGKLVHLDGLNFSRAWAYAMIASKLEPGSREAFQQVAMQHIRHSLSAISDGNYAGEHWLATFAVYALNEMERLSE